MRYLPLLAAALLVVGCTPKDPDIRQAAQRYLDATATYDVSSAVEYCTPSTAEGLKAIEKHLLSLADSSLLQANMPATIRISAVERTSDSTATVQYHKKTPIKQFDGTLDMVLRDGRWLAHLPISLPNVMHTDGQKVREFNYDSIAQRIADGRMELRAVPKDSLVSLR